jgi:hypothetical protein
MRLGDMGANVPGRAPGDNPVFVGGGPVASDARPAGDRDAA